MNIELNNIIIESKDNLPYISQLVDYYNQNEKRILDFFRIKKLVKKYRFIILPFKEFKKFIIDKYGKYNNYVRGDTDKDSHTIRVLSIEDQVKYTTHKNVTIEDYFKMIIHEFVHACHDEINTNYYKTIWFNEGIATNLSNQNYSLIDLNECDFDKLENNWYLYDSNKYNYAYTIVNYIINNYSSDEIYKLISDPNYLRNNSNRIFDEILNKCNK